MPQHWDTPRPAILLSSARSGSTALAHCLDQHPEIGWEREEPFSQAQQQWWNGVGLTAKNRILEYYLGRKGYHVSGCRIIYGQMRIDEIEALKRRFDPMVVHLIRRNYLRTMTSIYLVRARTAAEAWHTSHSYEPVQPVKLNVSPGTLVTDLIRLRNTISDHLTLLANRGYTTMEVYYDDLFSPGPENATYLNPLTRGRLCKFLGVTNGHMMYTKTARINPQPLREIYQNWDEIREAVSKTEFAEFVEE